MSIFLLLLTTILSVSSANDCGGEYIRRNIAHSADYLCTKVSAAGRSDEDILKQLSMLEEQTEQGTSSDTPPWTGMHGATNITEQGVITSSEEPTTYSEEPTTYSEEPTTYSEEPTTYSEEPTTYSQFEETTYFETETGPSETTYFPESETYITGSETIYSGIMSLPSDPDPSLMKQNEVESECTAARMSSENDYIWLHCEGLTAVVNLNTETGVPQILCCPVPE